jgi:translation initiation factor SUI1
MQEGMGSSLIINNSLFIILFIIQLILINKEFACNGTVVEHPEYGEVIQLQGDQRNNICQFLTKVGIAKQEQLKVHGF